MEEARQESPRCEGDQADETLTGRVADPKSSPCRLLPARNFPTDFEGKDPNDPEFQALRDQLAEKRRKWEARKKEIEERRKKQGKGKEADPKRRRRKRDKPEDDGER